MIGRKIVEIDPPVLNGLSDYEDLYRLSVKDNKTGAIYPMDVTAKGLKVILLENQILKSGCPEELIEDFKVAIRDDIAEDLGQRLGLED